MKIKKIKKKSKILVKAKLIAQQVQENYEEYKNLSIQDLKIRTDYLVDGLQKGKFTLEDVLVDAFSIAREIIFREHKMLAYEVQIMGAYVVHCGDFAEMYTGEGKSLTLLLVSFVNALTKRGVHIVTVNEYLVERDAEFARQAFEKLGITVGYNTSKLNKNVKREMFAKDITYTTNSELGFDYLKDNMVRSIEEKVIRDLNFVIVDEADSVLIDEARTPLIISGQPKEDLSLYLDVDKFAKTLVSDDYVIDNESNTIALSDSGVAKAERFFRLDNLYSVESAEIVHKITNSLVANFIFDNGKEYLVKDDKIYLVDQFTGRVLEGRSYNAGLQQAIQAKERVKIEPENVIMATITYQSFFRLYEKLSGVSGTAMTEAEEFLKIYNMVVVRIPTNKPVARIDKQDYIFGTKKVKWNHVIAEIIKRHETGQPILVGTASVTDSEIIHEKLTELNIPHEVLNARDNHREAEIVKHAGERGAITISTNMAGRGTDIKVPEEMRKLGGLYVIGTERHESRRIDNQLRGRTGRQGDPGESRFFTSLEDSLFKRFATDRFEKASQKLEAEFYDSKFFSRMLDRTQKKVEGLNFDIRKNLMDYDHVLSLQRELVYKQRDQILLKNSTFSIVDNMIDDFVEFELKNFRNLENTSLVDSNKLTTFLNERILRFDFFDKSFFSNMPLMVAADKLVNIIKKVIDVKKNLLEENNATSVVDEILLVNLDQKWTRHIDKMTKLREGVNLRSLEQRSPLNIYIEDGNNLFERMKSDIVNDTINSICNLSLPNDRAKITEALEELLGSEEFKKKISDNQKNHDQIYFSNSDNSFNEFENFIKDDEIPKSNESSYSESLINQNEIPEYESTNSEYYLGNTNNNEIPVSDQIDLQETPHEINEGISHENDITMSNPFNEEVQPILPNHHEENIPEYVELKQDEVSSQEQPQLSETIEEDIPHEESVSDKDIEKILDMPAFKDGEQAITLGNYLDNILDSMGFPDDSNEEDYEDHKTDSINAINENDLVEKSPEEENIDIDDYVKEIDLLDDENKNKIRDEIKKSIIFDLSNDPDFIKYKDSFFVNDSNSKIDYDKYKNWLNGTINENEVDDNEIKPFYKLPVVSKREPGSLFGGKLPDKSPFSFKEQNPYTKDLEKIDSIFKDENQISNEEMNKLLQIDDEESRLNKILENSIKVEEDSLSEEKLEEQINNEAPVYYLEDIPEGENLENFTVEEMPINYGLNQVTNQDIDFNDLTISNQPYETINDVNNVEIVQTENPPFDEINDYIEINPNEQNYDGLVDDLSKEDPEVIKSIIKDKMKNLSDVQLDPKIESEKEKTFLDRIKIIKKQAPDNDDSEIIQEMPKQKKEINNLQKEVIDYLEKINSPK